MKLLHGVFLSLALMSTASANPTIDGSNERQFDRSLEEVRASLSESEVEQFNNALASYMIRTLLADRNILEMDKIDDDELGELYNEARQSLHGLTAEEVLAKVSEGSPAEPTEVADIDQAADKEMLEQFVIESAEYRISNDGYSGGRPTIDLRVTNNTGEPVSRAYFRGVLQSPGRSVPWVDDTFNYSIAGGIEPGETLEWSLAPNMFGAWGNKSIPDDAELKIEVLQLDDPAGDSLWKIR